MHPCCGIMVMKTKMWELPELATPVEHLEQNISLAFEVRGYPAIDGKTFEFYCQISREKQAICTDLTDIFFVLFCLFYQGWYDEV